MENMSTLQLAILKIIDDYHEKSGGKCGLSAISVVKLADAPHEKVMQELNALHEKKMFKVRAGINVRLIFKKL